MKKKKKLKKSSFYRINEKLKGLKTNKKFLKYTTLIFQIINSFSLILLLVLLFYAFISNIGVDLSNSHLNFMFSFLMLFQIITKLLKDFIYLKNSVKLEFIFEIFSINLPRLTSILEFVVIFTLMFFIPFFNNTIEGKIIVSMKWCFVFLVVQKFYGTYLINVFIEKSRDSVQQNKTNNKLKKFIFKQKKGILELKKKTKPKEFFNSIINKVIPKRSQKPPERYKRAIPSRVINPLERGKSLVKLREKNKKLEKKLVISEKQKRTYQSTVKRINRQRSLSTKYQSKRSKIIKEFYFSEKRYVSQLTSLHVSFIVPILQKKKFMSKENPVNMLFESFFTVFETNSSFLEALEEILFESEKEVFLINLIIKFSNDFRFYSEYTKYFKNANDFLKTRVRKSKKFETFINNKQMELKEKGHRIYTLSGLLLCVIQRLPRYKLLLENLLKNTTKLEESYPKIKESIDKIETINQFINEESKKFRSEIKINDLNKKHGLQLNSKYKFFREITNVYKLEVDSENNYKNGEKVSLVLLSKLLLVIFEKKKKLINLQKKNNVKVFELTKIVKHKIVDQNQMIMKIWNFQGENDQELIIKFEEINIFVGFTKVLQLAMDDEIEIDGEIE